MAMVHVDGFISSSVLAERVNTSVWVKPTWASMWEYVPYLEPLTATQAVGPSVGRADIRWHYGKQMMEDQGAFSLFTPLNFQTWYVAIFGHTFYGTFPMWIGTIQQEAVEMHATDPTVLSGQGDQTLGAFGLEYLLSRRFINGAYVEGGGTFIHRIPAFNERHRRGLSNSGNRSTSRNGDGIYTFSRDDGEQWTGLDILEYVLWYFQPGGITWTLGGQAYVLDQIKNITFSPDGMTVKDVIDKIIRPQRGMGYRVITDGIGVAQIQVYSTSPVPINVADISHPANPWQDSVSFDNYVNLHPRVDFSSVHTYDKFVVQGAPLKVCMSMSAINATFEAAWSAADETAYNAATDEERKSDKHERVYATLRVPPAWDWTYNSLFDASASIANPTVLDDASIDMGVSAGYWNQGHRFERHIPMPVSTTVANPEEEFRGMFVIAPVGGGLYQYIDKMPPDGFHTFNVRPESREMAIRVTGAINHLLGLNHFDTAAPPPGATDIDAEIDWDELIATVFFETDEQFRAVWSIPNASETAKTLLINVPEAEAWVILPGTVSEVTDGVVQYWNGGTVDLVRDDGQLLRSIAVLAAAWYSVQRATLSYVFDNIAPFHPPGMMIRNASVNGWYWEPIGTVVTERRWDFQQNTTTIRTGSSELDFKLVAGGR